MAERRAVIRVEAVFVAARSAWAIGLELPPGATVAHAVAALRLVDSRPAALDAAIRAQRIGVFGRRVDATFGLKDGDRLEFYRPLTADPRDARRRRAATTG